MATTIDRAKAKLRAKIPSMRTNYPSAMSSFFGTDVSGSVPVRAYRAKIAPGMEDVWERNLKRAFGLAGGVPTQIGGE